MKTPAEILKEYWGYSSFRPLQEDIIKSVLEGHDTLALLPTGGGKSLCFQVPALCQEGICIVVSPLIALMQDQVARLKEKGIPAIAITSAMSRKEIDIAFDNCAYGKVKFLYLSPERLGTELARMRIAKMHVSLFAVDEAHCISQWGYDFRPPYLDIAEIRELHPNVPVMALTATATEKVAEDICTRLNFRKAKTFRQSFARTNLAYIVRHTSDKHGQILKLCRQVKHSGIIYTRNRRRTVEVAQFLQSAGITATYYHAGLQPAERTLRQTQWIENKVQVMVATNAFGMGIDKPDVRFVIHLDLPDSPEAYFQEAGRAGRDGAESGAILLWNESDIKMLEDQTAQAYPHLPDIRRAWQAVCNCYQLAPGSGENQTFIFDLKKISTTYNIDQLTLHHSMKAMEREGYIVMNDAVSQPSRVHITVNNEILYRYQVQNLADETLLKTMLRMYGGLFDTYVRISEMDLARKSGKSPEVVVSDLLRFRKLGLLDYIPRTDQPLMTLLQPCPESRTLHISLANLVERRTQAEIRVKAMKEFVTSSVQCRQSVLLGYFGEQVVADCGKCDVCRSRQSDAKKLEREQAEQKILEALKIEMMSMQDIVSLFPSDYSAEVNNILRKMLDREVIQFTADRKLRIRS